jgi:hypothetical protein
MSQLTEPEVMIYHRRNVPEHRLGAGGPRFSTTSHNRSDRPILLALSDPAAVNGRLRHFRGPLRADRMTVTRRSASGGASLQGGHQFGEVAEPVLGREVRPSGLGLPGIAGCRRQFFEEGLNPAGAITSTVLASLSVGFQNA